MRGIHKPGVGGKNLTSFRKAAQSFYRPQQVVAISFIFLLGLLVLGAVLSYRSVIATRESRVWVEHTYQVLAALDGLLIDLLNSETAGRTYALTRDDDLLARYTEGVKRVDSHLSSAKRLTADNPRQQRRLAELERLVRQRLALLEQGVEDARTARNYPEEDAARTLRGQEIMTRIRPLIGDIQQEEQRLLPWRSSIDARNAERTAHIILLSNCLLIAFMFIVAGVLFLKVRVPPATRNAPAEANSVNWPGYAVAVTATALAALLRWALGMMAGPVLHPFITFYPAVIFTALSGGVGPGLLASVLSSLTVTYFFLPPTGQLWAEGTADQVGLALFCGINVSVSLVCGALRAARTRTEAEARRAEQSGRRLQAMFDQAGMGIVEAGQDDRFLAVNQRLCQILDYTPEELIGKTAHELTHPEDRAASLRANADLREGRTRRINYEKRYLKRDGSSVWVHVTVSAVLDDEARWIRSIGTVEDISERKDAEERLRGEKALSDAMIRSVPGVFFLMNASQRLVRFNGDVLQVTGYTQEELLQMRVLDLVTKDDQVQVAELIRRVFDTGEGVAEVCLVGKNGTRTPYSFTARRFRVDGEVMVVAIGLELTAQKRAEEALRKAKDELAHANADLEQKVQERTTKLEETVAELEGFSYSLVHDLRAPLRAMQAYAAVLEDEYGKGPEPGKPDFLGRIKQAARRMDQLITDSLNYSRIMLQDMPIKPVNVGDLVRGLVETYPNLQSPGAEISIELGDLNVYGNEAALTQVFSNLLGNAVKFVPRDVKPRVRVWPEFPSQQTYPHEDLVCASGGVPDRRNGTVLIWVEDNGIGIPKHGQEKIFGMFQRMHGADEYPGTGIGLAIVRKSLDRIGGKVCLDSEPGKGSRFCVELQLAREAVEVKEAV